MAIKPKCDKCGVAYFDIVSTDPKPSATYVLASEYFKHLGDPQVSDAMLRYHHYQATCKKCGATYEYTLPY